MTKYTCVECNAMWTDDDGSSCPWCGGGPDPTLMEDDCDELEVWVVREDHNYYLVTPAENTKPLACADCDDLMYREDHPVLLKCPVFGSACRNVNGLCTEAELEIIQEDYDNHRTCGCVYNS